MLFLGWGNKSFSVKWHTISAPIKSSRGLFSPFLQIVYVRDVYKENVAAFGMVKPLEAAGDSALGEMLLSKEGLCSRSMFE